MMISKSSKTQCPGSDILDGSTSDWDALYCSHLWSDSNLRREIINAPFANSQVIKYCYTCKGKIRKYEVKSPKLEQFTPNNHSTPNAKISLNPVEVSLNRLKSPKLEQFTLNNHSTPNAKISLNPVEVSLNRLKSPELEQFTLNNHSTPNAKISLKPVEISVNRLNRNSSRDSHQLLNIIPSPQRTLDVNPCIPTISRHIDSSFRQKYISYEIQPNDRNRRRLRKSLKGIGCVVNFALPDTPVKKRTQIQACSISVMIIAIVAISFILVNFTSHSLNHRVSNVAASTTVVPTDRVSNNTSAAISDVGAVVTDGTPRVHSSSTEPTVVSDSKEGTSLISNIIVKIRKNIRTYPKNSKTIEESLKPKDINNRDLSKSFCSCQTDEVCMLDETNGTAICKTAVDTEDPTGCGGLCALETEACQLVDRARGVRVCRLVAPASCGAREWRCRNALCVPAAARCDGIFHCYDRSDEMHCDCDLTKEFRCGHSVSCFPNTKLCDGVIDCWDGIDELNCTSVCPDGQFTCTDGQCIAAARFCDGLADCADASDEPRGCGVCSPKEMRCANQRCVALATRCDSKDDCGDRTDELDCSV